MTVPVTENNLGTYYCHAEVSGYQTITSLPGAEVLMTGKIQIYNRLFFPRLRIVYKINFNIVPHDS